MQVEGVRRILALVQGLPLEAAVWREDRPQWTTEHELLATVAEVSDGGFRALFAALGGKADGKPLKIEHPHRNGGKPERRRVSMDELMKGG